MNKIKAINWYFNKEMDKILYSGIVDEFLKLADERVAETDNLIRQLIEYIISEGKPNPVFSTKDHITKVANMLGDETGESNEYSKGWINGYSEALKEYEKVLKNVITKEV